LDILKYNGFVIGMGHLNPQIPCIFTFLNPFNFTSNLNPQKITSSADGNHFVNFILTLPLPLRA
jgi:hypothetical protein